MKDFNATAAYLRAGYRATPASARTESSKTLTNPNVQAYLFQLRQRVSDRTQVTLERTVEEIARVAFSNITQTLSFDVEGVRLRSSSQLPDEVTAAIASVSSTELTKTFRDATETTVTYSLKMHNKVSALTLLADFFGIRDDFNKARATLKRYGLLVVQDTDSDLGWRLERADSGPSDTGSAQADNAATEFFTEEE